MNAGENENAVLGCLMAYPDQSAPYVCAEIRPEHLFGGGNADIYREILALHSEGLGIDVPTIAGRLRDKEKLESVGGFARLSELSFASNVLKLLPEHVRVIKEKAAQRRIVRLLTEKRSEAESPACDVSSLLSSLMAEAEAIGHDRAKRKTPTTKELVVEAVQRIQKRNSGEGDATGVSTGIKRLDKETGGIRPSAQWVLAGPSKGGKSALASCFLKALAIDAGKRCAFFGLEMPSVENVERLICNVGRVSASNSRDGVISHQDMGGVTRAAGSIATAPIHFRDDIFDLNELIATARQIKAAYPDLYAVFVDYAQLVGGSDDEKSREREVAIISRTFRRFSMQTGVCTILLSQLNDDGKLRESRALGMDATKIVFIEFTENPNTRKLRLIQRDGGSGVSLTVAYIGEHFLFADLAEGEQEENEPPKKKKRKWND